MYASNYKEMFLKQLNSHLHGLFNCGLLLEEVINKFRLEFNKKKIICLAG